AVGRLAFDAPDQYRQYAESIAAYESVAAGPRNAREIVYWGTRHPGDRSTQMSADSLIRPLTEGIPAAADQAAEAPVAADRGFRSRSFKAADATKASLLTTLHPGAGTAPPAVLFTASHGMGWPRDDPRQQSAQGALLCQDWAGFGQVAPAHYLTAPDI